MHNLNYRGSLQFHCVVVPLYYKINDLCCGINLPYDIFENDI